MVRAMLISMVTALIAAAPAQADPVAPGRPVVKLTDAELARITGKFILPNGVELALTVTSDTVVDGQLLLRTVLTVDKTAAVQVLGRQGGTAAIPYAATTVTAAAGGVTVAMDRRSGIQTVTPTVSVASGPSVSLGVPSQSAEDLGLSKLALTPGGPAVATADGVVSLETVRNGTRVAFAGDQLAVVNLVGQSVATAVLNSADNRTLDTVTNITIDARNLAPYQAGAAQLRVGDLAIEATRGMIR